jgi:16S rRNA (cytosine1402-N4)-methyltransferase
MIQYVYMECNYYHQPVLTNPLITHFSLTNQACIGDGTVGFGGHAEAILSQWPGICYYGFDKDAMAIDCSKNRLAGFDHVHIERLPFSRMIPWFRDRGITPTHLFVDLGVSSYQIDQSQRGFSFQRNEPLDMRMDERDPLTAATIVNTFSKDALRGIFCDESGISHPDRLVDAILHAREAAPLVMTSDVVGLVKRVAVVRSRQRFISECTRVFQALRVAVNYEMNELTTFLNDLTHCPGVTVAIITFQPNEDRRVKQCIRHNGWQAVSKKPFMASYHECKKNPRERTAKLRIFTV